MSRQIIRQLKRAVRAGARYADDPEAQRGARESALRLLERSISFGHRKLAIVRLSNAVNAGAAIETEHWRYCREVASTSRDPSLQALFLAAASTHPSRLPLS